MIKIVGYFALYFSLLCTHCVSGAPLFRDGSVGDAAYFGDSTKVEEWINGAGGFDKMHFGNGNKYFIGILQLALLGKQPEVVKLFIRMGFPKEAYDASDIFELSAIDVDGTRIFATNLPEFTSVFGVYALRGAIKSSNREVVKYLLDLGVDPNGHDRKKNVVLPLLAEALGTQQRDIVELLLGSGADPYQSGLIESAIRGRSADLVRLLDRKHRYEKEALELEKKFAPPSGSPFPGRWAFQKEGFGSSSFHLRKDGTGSMSTDVGGFPLIWKSDADVLSLFPLMPPNGEISDTPKLQLKLSQDRKSLRAVAENVPKPEPVWTRWNPPTEREVTTEPQFLGIEAIYLSPDLQRMALQINRRHLKFDLAEYLKASESGHWPQAQSPKNTNLIKWSEFKNGPIQETDVQGWWNVPFVERGASLAYSRHWDELGFDHQTKTTMPEGNDYTLFPCGSERWNDQYVQGFVLFSNNPLPNGKRVMFFYLDGQVMKRALGPTL